MVSGQLDPLKRSVSLTHNAVIQEIEEEDIWASKDRRREKRRLRKEEAKSRALGTAEQAPDTTDSEESKQPPDQARKPPTFY